MRKPAVVPRLAVALSILAAAPGPLLAQADVQLLRAVRLYEELQIAQARDVFLQVVSPSSPFAVTEAQRVTAYKYLGASYATLGIQDSAITFFLAALQRDPLTDLDPRSFAEAERSVFNLAKRQIFRIGLRPLPTRPDTLDPRTQTRNFGVITTHQGAVLLELASTEAEQRYTLFEGEVDGVRDVSFNGVIPGGLIPPGEYELVLVGRSALDSTRRDSTSRLVELLHDLQALEDTLVDLTERDLLPERAPPSIAVRDLLRGFGIGGAAIVSSKFIGRTDLNERSALSASVALLGLGAGVYAYLHRRNHPELPVNVSENADRRRRRAETNAAVMQRNADRVARTKLVLRPLTF